MEKISRQVDFPDISFRHEKLETPSPFKLELDIYSTKDSFVFSGILEGEILLTCSRCLEKFLHGIKLKIDEELMKNEIDDLSRVDLTSNLVEDILLSLPIKPVCSEDCKGLCSVCGHNLNEGDCGCNRESIDPRLAKLKEFYDKQ